MQRVWVKRYGQDFCKLFSICLPYSSFMRNHSRSVIKMLLVSKKLVAKFYEKNFKKNEKPQAKAIKNSGE